MCQSSQQQFAGVTGMVNVQTANPNLSGQGQLNTLLTADPAQNGLLVKSITIKAAATNGQNIMRFFIGNGKGLFILWKEVPVPPVSQSETTVAYQTTVRANYMIEPGYSLLVTTQNAENWNFIAEAVNWTNCACS